MAAFFRSSFPPAILDCSYSPERYALDRKLFFTAIRASIFGGKLTTHQVLGVTAILDQWDRSGVTDGRQLAYVLATAYHESAHTMEPVRETLATSDDQAIARLESAWKSGKLPWVKTPYWRKDASGKSWFGRGLVQLTFKSNYEKFGVADDPNKALDLATAAHILVTGSIEGTFSGAKLSDYINKSKADYVRARRIINGSDRAALVARYALQFEAAIKGAA